MDSTLEKARIARVQGQRARVITTVTFFVGGLAVLLSLDLSGSGSSIGFRPDGLYILIGGLVLAVLLYVVLQKVIPKSRHCANCRQEVLLGASTCSSCGQPIRRATPGTGTLPPRG